MSTNLSSAIETETPNESIVVSINSDNIDTNLSENNNNYSEKFQPENNLLKWNKKPTKAEQAAIALQERNTYLHELGKKLQKARKMRYLSMKQIHKQTFVPLHYLEAIEKGETEKLPEDVYLRGFIFRLGNALGFDGVTLAAELPISNSLQGLMPSWSKSNKDFGFYLHPAYLYLGYTALMAGAVSGLSWISQQPSPGANIIPDTLEPADSVAHSDRDLETTQTPGLKSTTGSLVVGSDMAPPETMI
ncbi:helix-turn-helix domain-containing protein [Hydrocoleum sp. CS-953]|uniref:helix-turn-helix domain-containing protein n=1 Tax=Hydrocoleum sp. CS-953 TaxID=1671698 RepID=UPI00352AC057